MRVKRVIISDPFITNILSWGTEASRVVKDALPSDAVLVAVSRFSGFGTEFQFHSSEFEDIPEGQEIPILNPIFERA